MSEAEYYGELYAEDQARQLGRYKDYQEKVAAYTREQLVAAIVKQGRYRMNNIFNNFPAYDIAERFLLTSDLMTTRQQEALVNALAGVLAEFGEAPEEPLPVKRSEFDQAFSNSEGDIYIAPVMDRWDLENTPTGRPKKVRCAYIDWKDSVYYGGVLTKKDLKQLRKWIDWQIEHFEEEKEEYGK